MSKLHTTPLDTLLAAAAASESGRVADGRALLGERPEHEGPRARLDALSRAIASLEDDQRDVFTLADIEELTAPEIAEALGCKLNTVYSRLRRARAKVTSAMEQFEADTRSFTQPPVLLQERRHGSAQ